MLLLEQFDKFHDLGSSAGESRISRNGDEAPFYPFWTSASRRTMQRMENKERELINFFPGINVVHPKSKAYKRIIESAYKAHFSCTEWDAGKLGVVTKLAGNVLLKEEVAATMNPRNLLDKMYAEIEKRGGGYMF